MCSANHVDYHKGKRLLESEPATHRKLIEIGVIEAGPLDPVDRRAAKLAMDRFVA